jgi:hypothetical protein
MMVLEFSFWAAVVTVGRNLAKRYARRGDVLYGSYVSQ